MTITTPAPAVGQVWKDNDARAGRRRLRIVEIDGTHAVCEPAVPRPPVGNAKPGRRRTRIRLNRFQPTSTGYCYVGGAS